MADTPHSERGATIARPLAPALAPLRDLALDLRWTWSHAADDLWRTLDPDAWDRLENPWALLHDVSDERLTSFSQNPTAMMELARIASAREAYLRGETWFGRAHPRALRSIAYFSMEFGLGEALPLYAGGLGVLAGDMLKTASDLGVPLVGVGLLYQQGYFRQVIDAEGRQREAYPFSDSTSLPIEPVRASNGAWSHVTLDLAGRRLYLRVWRARVGRTALYLLDSNDPLNVPADRGITGRLYGSDKEERFLQEIVLGVGGWRMLEALGIEPDILHLNEGHPAFAILERARSLMQRAPLSFDAALWATRAGNVFTTHTALETAFDAYDAAFVERHRAMLERYVAQLGLTFAELMALGRREPNDRAEPFTLSYLAVRGCIASNGVSALHRDASRRLFRGLFPRWPEHEVPVQQVTNGVHVPTWDSPSFDALWETRCGKERWLGSVDNLSDAIAAATDEELWSARGRSRAWLVSVVRQRLARQLAARGEASSTVAAARETFDATTLTLGFARRFTPYKRPTLLLSDPARLTRLLTDPRRPVQLIVAGKAHPNDVAGKDMVQQWVRFVQQPEVRPHVVFLEDYDFTLAEEMVRGVDVWLNTPLRPWEACGTSGMKVLANGGLNLSTLDGWWAEAYGPDVGWAIENKGGPPSDAADAGDLYRLLEEEIVPLFYMRDERGVPVNWLAHVRQSMARLTPRFSAHRMLTEYVDRMYLPGAELKQAREESGCREASALAEWERTLRAHWSAIDVGALEAREHDGGFCVSVTITLGAIDPSSVLVELYADAVAEEPTVRVAMTRKEAVPDMPNAARYVAELRTPRPLWHFTPRVQPRRTGVSIPTELPLIAWCRR
ncbi:MAG TPA: alpha-glucan family phosphorylase [Gemmatimonadaceae bacterium]